GDAKRDLDSLASAAPATAGACVLVLGADALLHEGLGVWAAFASQADAVIERQGLTRYRERTPIAPDAEKLAEPLTITSNGAIAYGVRSAPLGDHGDAVRTFKLVERGTAAGLSLTPREGALRGRDPNGGVRNLVVEAGTWPGTIDAGAVRVVELRRLRSLSIDPYTGDASLEIALGIEHTAKGGAKPVTGGAIRIDLIAALAKAKRSSRTITRGAYTGPDAVSIDRAELIT
ncbi:MAG TPA: metallopeptidase TldD-related protein, partial [Kofleriaceae bacterium]